jgi:hypothetical protein
LPDVVGMTKARKIMRMRHAARKKEKKNEYAVVAGQPEGKRYLGKHRRKW